jgi:hypothetical protein
LLLQQVNAEGQPADWEAPSSRAFILFMGAAMSFTAFPVLASLLSSAGLLGSPIGIQVGLFAFFACKSPLLTDVITQRAIPCAVLADASHGLSYLW